MRGRGLGAWRAGSGEPHGQGQAAASSGLGSLWTRSCPHAWALSSRGVAVAPLLPSLPFPHAWHSGRRRAPQQRAPFRNRTAGSKGGERGGTQPVPGLGVRSEPLAARRGAVLSQPPARSGLAQR